MGAEYQSRATIGYVVDALMGFRPPFLLVALLAATANAQAEGPVSPEPPALPPESTFSDKVKLSMGIGTFGELFPVSSAKVPRTTRGQFAVAGGIQFLLGARLLPATLRASVVMQIGYVNAGYFPNRAADGLMEGIGLEVAFERWMIKPFVRFMYDALVVPLRESAESTLSSNAYFVSAGVKVSVLELHLSVGKDFAGGISPGLGLSLSALY